MGARPSRRDQILDAALELFATQGITATTTRDVAARAGVATGSVFYHFATKPDLIEAVLGRAYVGPDLQTIADRSDRPVRERLLERLSCSWRRCANDELCCRWPFRQPSSTTATAYGSGRISTTKSAF